TANPDLVSQGGMSDLGMWAMRSILTLAAPVALAAAAAGVVASIIQVRPRLTGAVIKPQFSRIDPRQGFKRIFGVSALFETLKATAKTLVVGGAAFFAIYPRLAELASLTGMPPGAMLVTLASLVARIALYVCLSFGVIAVGDYL